MNPEGFSKVLTTWAKRTMIQDPVQYCSTIKNLSHGILLKLLGSGETAVGLDEPA